MVKSYFLGANSAKGFFSLYDGFAAGKGDYLSVIKGGPGTGKSSFMRRIGECAENKGLDVEYVLCSGDPSSLDGVYIPSLHRGWVDGTAPHACDPDKLGINGDYVNLSIFCRTPFSPEVSEEAEQLYRNYRVCYRRAYACLNAALTVKNARFAPRLTDEESARLRKRISRVIPKIRNGQGSEKRCFLRCLSGEGEMVLSKEITKTCKKVYCLDSRYGIDETAMSLAYKELKKANADMILCLSPLEPEKIEALLLPEYGLALLNKDCGMEKARRIRLDSLTEKTRQCSTNTDRVGNELTKAAMTELSQAKKLHDELEEIYKKAMDYKALNKFIEKYLNELFKK